MYIRQKTDEELANLLMPYLIDADFIQRVPTPEESGQVLRLIPLVKERLKVLSDVTEMVRFLFVDIPVPETASLLPKKQDIQTTITVLEQSLVAIASLSDQSDEIIEGQLVELAQTLDIKVNGVFMPIRVAITGSTVSPPLFDSIRMLGLETALARIERALEKLKHEVA
jgi:glutamyl-tRNA synthetase